MCRLSSSFLIFFIAFMNKQKIAFEFFRAFPALKYRNYQLYFAGQLISLTGTWLQIVAQGWLVLLLTHSAFMVGLVSAIGMLPVLIFVLFGGVIADRFPKKNILLLTQGSSMVLAFILGLLTVLGIINVIEICILAFLLGLANSIDSPARHAFAVEMVGKEDLGSAIALNSGIFNGARVVGPAIAGIVIALYSAGGAFLLNAASYIAVIIALLFIKTKVDAFNIHSHPLKAIKEGLSYSFSHFSVKKLLILTGATSIFGWSYITIMPVVVSDVFHKGATFLGYFYSVSGIGAVFGAILISILFKKVEPKKIIIIGNIIFVVSLISFTFTTNLFLALFFLFLTGFGLIVQVSTTNNLIQQNVNDGMRGRIMSIYSFMFAGMAPIGNFQI